MISLSSSQLQPLPNADSEEMGDSSSGWILTTTWDTRIDSSASGLGHGPTLATMVI